MTSHTIYIIVLTCLVAAEAVAIIFVALAADDARDGIRDEVDDLERRVWRSEIEIRELREQAERDRYDDERATTGQDW